MDSRVNKLISVVIPVHKREGYLEKCLESIKDSELRDCEVVVMISGMDIGYEKRSKRWKKELKKFKIVSILNVGPAEKRNIGVKESKADYILFLDSDVRVDKKGWKKMLEYLEKNRKVGAGQVKILKENKKAFFDSAGEKISSLGFLVERARSSEDRGQFDKPEDIFSGKTAGMIIRREVFLKVGGFDKDYFMYWEEPDFCWRVWKAGFRVVFLPMVKVWHGFDGRRVGKKQLERVSFWGCRNQVITMMKNGVGIDLWRGTLTVFLGWFFLGAVFFLKGQIGRGRAVFEGLGFVFLKWRKIFEKRRENKVNLGRRFYCDEKWMKKVVVKRDWKWYWGKGVNYVLNRPY